MSYASTPAYASSPPTPYSSTPPVPPPKPSGSATPTRGPPLPPPPPGQQQQYEISELDGNSSQHPQTQPSSQPPIPIVEHNWLPETLKEKNTSDLHRLLEDSDLQSALLNNPNTTHPAIPASEEPLQPLIESNLALADSLLQLEARLNQQREKSQSRLLSLRALEQQHRSKLSETEDALQSFSPMALYQRLSASVQEQEQLVRGLEESWLDEGGMASDREIGEFVRRVKENKKTAFLRAERKRRWDEGRVGGWR
jgi:type IV secretory pathway VirB10-like protein